VGADVGDFPAGRPAPQVRVLTPSAAALRFPPGNVHSAVPVPGRALALLTDERFPAPYGPGCPSGAAHLVDTGNPAAPRVLSTLTVPENDPDLCASAPLSTWTSHNATLTANLALVSWYGAGIQVFDTADPVQPARLAEHRPSGITPARRDPELGGTAALTWSYPVVAAGLVYVADINQGLVVLRYRGPHQEELDNAVLLEGESNAVAGAAAASPVPVSPSALPPPSAPSAESTGMGLSSAAIPIAAVAVVLVLVGLSVPARRRRRRRRGSAPPAGT
jgi:hypothetical protein